MSTENNPQQANFPRHYAADQPLPNGAESCLLRAVRKWAEGDIRGATGALNLVYLKLEIEPVCEEST